MSQTLIAFDDLARKGITLSRTQIWRNERAGIFPKRVQLSAARVAWVESEVDAWIAERIAARDRVAA